MILVIIIALAFLVFWDSRWLREQNETLYKSVMCYTEREWALWHILLMVAVLPVYLLRRREFKKNLTQLKDFGQEATALVTPQAPALEHRFLLASDAIEVILTWILGMTGWIFVEEAITFFLPSFKEGIEEVIVSAAVSFFLMIFLIYKVLKRHPQENFFRFIALTRPIGQGWKIFLLPIVVGLLFAVVSATIILKRPEQPTTPLSKIIDTTTSSSWLLVFLAMAILVAPLLEEIIFRGYFYRILLLIKGKLFAICFISGVFAFLHVGQYWGDWPAIGMVAILGFVLTNLRAWTESTLASTITHYTYNAGVTLIPIIMLVLANPAYVEYRLKYGQLDYAAKEDLLKKSIAKDPTLAEAYNDLAWIYAEQNKNLEEALELVEKALTYDIDNPAFLDTKAEILYQMGRFKEAIVIEEGLVDQEGPSPDYYQKQLERFREGLGLR